jgi:hypothetical protein
MLSILVSYVLYTSWLKEIYYYIGFFTTYLMFISLPILYTSLWPYKASLYHFLEIIVQLSLRGKFYT